MNFDKEDILEDQIYQEKLKLKFLGLFKNFNDVESNAITILREFIYPILNSLSEESFSSNSSETIEVDLYNGIKLIYKNTASEDSMLFLYIKYKLVLSHWITYQVPAFSPVKGSRFLYSSTYTIKDTILDFIESPDLTILFKNYTPSIQSLSKVKKVLKEMIDFYGSDLLVSNQFQY